MLADLSNKYMGSFAIFLFFRLPAIFMSKNGDCAECASGHGGVLTADSDFFQVQSGFSVN